MKPTTAKSGRQTDIRIALPWHSELGPISPAIDAPAYEATNRRMVVYEGMVRQPHTEHLIAHIHRLHLPRDRLNPHMLTPTQFLSFGRSDCRELRVDVSLNDPIGPLPRGKHREVCEYARRGHSGRLLSQSLKRMPTVCPDRLGVSWMHCERRFSEPRSPVGYRSNRHRDA